MKRLIVFITLFHSTLSIAQGIFSEVPLQNLLEQNDYAKKLSIPYIHNTKSNGPAESFHKLTSKWAVISFNDYDPNIDPHYRYPQAARIVNLDTGRDVLKFSFKDFNFRPSNLNIPYWDQKKSLIYYNIAGKNEDYLEINPEKATILIKKKSKNPRLKFIFPPAAALTDSRSDIKFFVEEEKEGFRVTNLDINKSIFIEYDPFVKHNDVYFEHIDDKLISPNLKDNNVPLVVKNADSAVCGTRLFLINPLTLKVIHSMKQIEGCGGYDAGYDRSYLQLDLNQALIYTVNRYPETTSINLISGKAKWKIVNFKPIKRVSERYLLGVRTDGTGAYYPAPIAYVLVDIESGDVKSLPMFINNLLTSGFLVGIDSIQESGKSISGTVSFLNFDSTDVGFSIESIGSIKFNSGPNETLGSSGDVNELNDGLKFKSPFLAYTIHPKITPFGGPSYAEFWADTKKLLFARAEAAEFVTPQLVVVKNADKLEIYRK